MKHAYVRPLTPDDTSELLHRALEVCPAESLSYTPLAHVWLCRNGVRAYEFADGVVARAIVRERERRVHIIATEDIG